MLWEEVVSSPSTFYVSLRLDPLFPKIIHWPGCFQILSLSSARCVFGYLSSIGFWKFLSCSFPFETFLEIFLAALFNVETLTKLRIQPIRGTKASFFNLKTHGIDADLTKLLQTATLLVLCLVFTDLCKNTKSLPRHFKSSSLRCSGYFESNEKKKIFGNRFDSAS